EAAAWAEGQLAVKERQRFYDDRVRECVARLRSEFDVESFDHPTWQEVKLFYIGLLVDHRQPELAETFFNSVITKILNRSYADNDLIFVRPAISTEAIEPTAPIYRSYYPGADALHGCLVEAFDDFGWDCPFADLEHDVAAVVDALAARLYEHVEPNRQIQVLASPFYRGKAAYVLGRVVDGHDRVPFAVPVLHTPGGLALDTVLLDESQISVLFSLTRAYFMVDMEVPSAYVEFVRSLAQARSPAELYTTLGLTKQGKTLFFRELLQHLQHSGDAFVEAEGIKGQVMLVFTLPSFPYVFKVIKDEFGSGKDTTRAKVMEKFAMVKHVDRVGRMADTLEFTELVLPLDRFAPELLDELAARAASVVDAQGERLVVRHCYVERRMTPLNLYLERADEQSFDAAVRDYGNAVRELAIANIFPGDMLWRNFGVSRSGRVVFYDYDEIEYLDACTFRRIPPPPDTDAELSGEAWYGALPRDVFPEEFATFLLGDPRVRAAFLEHNEDLLTPEAWQGWKRAAETGEIPDFFPYDPAIRFCNRPRVAA
ncbi:MAG: bifunctional isocitrate dehydrogenase kinase/phosphatase, partial [Actinomycetota bacterium]